MRRSGRGRVVISFPLLLLDVAGSFLLALGLLEFAGRPGLVVSEAWQFPYYAITMMVLGALLTLPFLFDLFRQVARGGEAGRSAAGRRSG